MSYVGQLEQVLEIIDVFPGKGLWERTFSLYVDDGGELSTMRAARSVSWRYPAAHRATRLLRSGG